ncbi:MAG TPA: serine hydrolase domain-containing protein [Byssovorax sp.]|jgi:CubicO group peptidase (beta-lactamase class C family)
MFVARDLGAIARAVVESHRASPAAVVAAAAREGDAWTLGAGAAGALTYDADALPAAIDTPFDLASVTKSVVALAFARLERAGVTSRGERLADALPELAGTRSADVPLDLLLAHRGGLDAHRTLFAPLLEGRAVDRAAALVEAADARRDGCEGAPPGDGFAPVYSDLGYLLVGEAMRARAGLDLDEIVAREVSAPLGLTLASARQWERDRPDRFARVAPTELAPFRGGVVRGRVHDENAFALVDGASAGHAGLFGDALDVARLGAAILDALAGRSAWLSAEELAPLVRARPGGSHRAGFDGKSGASPSAGARFGPRTFGHLGFTGTSLWMDPDAELAGVLLTNRVHPTRDHVAIRAARPAVYDALFAAMRG